MGQGTITTTPVTDKQVWFLAKLAGERLPGGRADLDAMVAALESAGSWNRGNASTLIDRLCEMPRVISSAPAPEDSEAPEGVHFLDGSYLKLQISAAGHRYVKRLVGRIWDYEGRGLLARLSSATLLAADQAAAFGKTHGWCVFCSRDLTDERSLSVGYGPRCAQNQSLPWGEVAVELTTPAVVV